MIIASSGLSGSQNVRFSSGISATSGIKGTLPASYQAYYPFISDFEDQVSREYLALFDNTPSFGGGGVNTVANTNLRVTTFQEDGKGVYLDEPATATVPCVLGNRSDAGWDNGVMDGGGRITFANVSGVAGKYELLASALDAGSILTRGSSALIIISNQGTSGWNVATLQGDVNDFKFPNEFSVDRSFSGYYPNFASVGTVRTNAGDDVSGFSAPEQWDTSGDFRFGYIGIGKTVADLTGQVLLQTGNMGISTGLGITFAEIGASISALSVDSDTIVGECFVKYVGGMLSIVIDGVESTPVASAAPAIGAFAQTGANVSNALAAPGTYGGLLFEAL